MRMPRIAAALSFAAAMSLASLPVQAAPLTALSAAAKPAAQDSNVTQVRWGGWHGGWHGGDAAMLHHQQRLWWPAALERGRRDDAARGSDVAREQVPARDLMFIAAGSRE